MKFNFLLLTMFLASSCFCQRFLEPTFEVSINQNITYGESETYLGENLELILDFYEPENDTMSFRPLLIYAHGGGFIDENQSKDLVHIVAYCDSLAARGYAVASINYRLDSAINNRAIMNAMHDMRAAVRFFKLNNEEYGINPDLIIVAGESAGAITSLNTAYINSDSEVLLPSTPPIVSEISTEGSSGNEGIDSSVKAVLCLCGGAETSLGDALFHPQNINTENDPALVMVNGTEDSFIPIAEALEIAIQAESVGVANLFFTLPGADHCPWFWPLENSWLYMDSLISYTVPFMYSCVTELGNNTEEIQQQDYTITPNPAENTIVLNGIQPNDQILIFNQFGQICQNSFSTKNMDISELESGAYVLIILRNEKIIFREKLFKQ